MSESKYVWRIDTELLTLVRVSKKKLHEDTPLEVFLPVTIGDGYYAYYESEKYAKGLLSDMIDTKIKELEEIKAKLNNVT